MEETVYGVPSAGHGVVSIIAFEHMTFWELQSLALPMILQWLTDDAPEMVL